MQHEIRSGEATTSLHEVTFEHCYFWGWSFGQITEATRFCSLGSIFLVQALLLRLDQYIMHPEKKDTTSMGPLHWDSLKVMVVGWAG